jgi:hypothetical protein
VCELLQGSAGHPQGQFGVKVALFMIRADDVEVFAATFEIGRSPLSLDFVLLSFCLFLLRCLFLLILKQGRRCSRYDTTTEITKMFLVCCCRYVVIQVVLRSVVSKRSVVMKARRVAGDK